MNELLTKAISENLGYAMFVFLFLWVLKKQDARDVKSEAREAKYQSIICELTNDVKVKLDKLLDEIKK